jgi:hypothetical protein
MQILLLLNLAGFIACGVFIIFLIDILFILDLIRIKII